MRTPDYGIVAGHSMGADQSEVTSVAPAVSGAIETSTRAETWVAGAGAVSDNRMQWIWTTGVATEK